MVGKLMVWYGGEFVCGPRVTEDHVRDEDTKVEILGRSIR